MSDAPPPYFEVVGDAEISQAAIECLASLLLAAVDADLEADHQNRKDQTK